MKIPDCPAAHSMDTTWFAVDDQGKVGRFDTYEIGALPNGALADQEGTLEAKIIGGALIAQINAGQTIAWSRAKRDPEDIRLIGASKPSLRTFVSEGHLELAFKGPPALYLLTDGLDGDEELLGEILAHPDCLGYLTERARDTKAGMFRFAPDDVPGSYLRQGQGSLDVSQLPAPLAKRVARLKLPLSFARTKEVKLWEHMSEDDCTVWESGLVFDGGIAAEKAARFEQASGVRRFELSEGSSNKFWEILVDGKATVVRFGKIGTAGQEQRKGFANEDAALADSERLVREKLNKGYSPAGAAAAPAAPAMRAKWTPGDAATDHFFALFQVRLAKPAPPTWMKEKQVDAALVSEALVRFPKGQALEKVMQGNGLSISTGFRTRTAFFDTDQLKLPEGRLIANEELKGTKFEKGKGEITARFAGRISTEGAAEWLHLVVLRGRGLEELSRDHEQLLREQRERAETELLEEAAKAGDLKTLLDQAHAATVKRLLSDLVAVAVDSGQWKTVDALGRKVGAPGLKKLLGGQLHEYRAAADVRELLKRGADPNRNSSLLFEARSAEALRPLIAAGLDVRRRVEGRTALHVTRDPEIIRELIKAKAEVNARDKEGATPLANMVSFIDEKTEACVKLLLAAGADPRIKEGSRTPIEILDAHVAGRSIDKAKTKTRGDRIKALLLKAQR